ncbi:Methyltransferase domain-containing protein [Maribacter orientalis]|uniref:Methyltransferase domain-containing protein n=1 Tax=Maribacter orientalis TaxID=228957 RepID=A0A1H7K332_9FLAO|nr:class I SAM-dependent methyltransferase [Maribacter orientalis]SEK81268.1 Methyltransferase domain-containing protein [Maribacter orientalis]
MKKKVSEKKNIKKPWPTKDAMEQVYAMQLWGDDTSNFYSGDGSHHPEIIEPYIEVVTSFLKSFEQPMSVCDLGCGDFNVGKELVKYAEKYVAVDIVEDLIAYNKKKFKHDNLEFQCLDIAVDNLPFANCVLLRQVLQHISNAEIRTIVHKLTAFEYVILTEHLPEGEFIPNKDIISGQGIRLKKQSGVNLLAPPFNFKVKEQKHVLSSVALGQKGVIVTTIYKVF